MHHIPFLPPFSDPFSWNSGSPLIPAHSGIDHGPPYGTSCGPSYGGSCGSTYGGSNGPYYGSGQTSGGPGAQTMYPVGSPEYQQAAGGAHVSK